MIGPLRGHPHRHPSFVVGEQDSPRTGDGRDFEVVLTAAVDEGFDRIWGTDAELSMGLLLKLGYENDLEECVKYF